jgi:hypothetical protein
LTRPDVVLYDAGRINFTDNRTSASSGLDLGMSITPLYQTLNLCKLLFPQPYIFQAESHNL